MRLNISERAGAALQPQSEPGPCSALSPIFGPSFGLAHAGPASPPSLTLCCPDRQVEIPNVDDHVSKLEHMGKETVKKLQVGAGPAVFSADVHWACFYLVEEEGVVGWAWAWTGSQLPRQTLSPLAACLCTSLLAGV